MEDSQRSTLTVRNNLDVERHESATSSPNEFDHNDATSKGSLMGIASVIDGDTIDVMGTRIRLHGIDAPEIGQLCAVNSAKYKCGQRSTFYLEQLLGRSVVTCETLDTDRYGRTIATCSVNGSDIGASMVASGWALAYRRYDDVYVPHETDAKNAGRGIWQGEFIEPALWRSGERL
ncbi:nuclease (SNase-like) protein [Roseobacter sp. AzwK-3b]|nr:nuclease (SNase-like) protein [Roseobacter sp. AzwK-3b]